MGSIHVALFLDMIMGCWIICLGIPLRIPVGGSRVEARIINLVTKERER